MSAGKILVVDDDPQIRRVMRIMLTAESYEVDDARTGETAIDNLLGRRFDLVLLDMGMPGAGGLDTCRQIREQSDVAIIVLTVLDRHSDRIEALDAGADDYITKPFKSRELLARIRAALRRSPSAHAAEGRLALGSTTIDFDARLATVDGRSRHLTPKEFDLLQYLVARPNRVLTHREVLRAVWGAGHGDHLEALRAVVHQLRGKIESNPASPSHLLTESWVGYRFTPSDEDVPSLETRRPN